MTSPVIYYNTAMRNAFTLVELMIVIAIIAVIAAIAIPNLTAHRAVKPGSEAVVLATGQRVRVVAVDIRTDPSTVLCRIDHGEKASPRYEEARFTRAELGPVPPAGPE